MRETERRTWYGFVLGLAETHPRLFALITVGSYLSTTLDLIEFFGEAVNSIIDLVQVLESLVG